MGQQKRHLEALEDLRSSLEQFGIEVGSLVVNEDTDEVEWNSDTEADKASWAELTRRHKAGAFGSGFTLQEVKDEWQSVLNNVPL